MLTSARIAEALHLAVGRVQPACVDYLCDRPLTIEPVIRSVLRSPLVRERAEHDVLVPLRLFRAAVRGLDDLLDGSEREPGGRAAGWARFGRATTGASALAAWERSLALSASPRMRRAIARESEAMLAAAQLEAQAVLSARRGQLASFAELRALERRIRDKEIAYWRLVFALIADCWRGSREALAALEERMLHCGDLWQRLDDARDFHEDLAEGRLSSFVLELLAGPDDASRPWRARVEAMLRADGATIEAQQHRRIDELERAKERASRHIDEVATMSGLTTARVERVLLQQRQAR